MRSRADQEEMRVLAVLAAMLAGLLFLAGALAREQLWRGQSHLSSQSRQSLRRVLVPALRGTITDRYGRVLAQNLPRFNLALYVEELRQRGGRAKTANRIDRELDRLAAVLRLPRETTTEAVLAHLQKRTPMPLFAWSNLRPEALARWAEQGAGVPGVDVYVESVREYPHGRTLCHVLGYVRSVEPGEEEREEAFDYYLRRMQGREGIERRMDAVLAGEWGGRLLRVDASGYRYDEVPERPARNGRSVALTIDLDIQKLAEEALEGGRGAVVVLDPRNGDVLAMASAPSFDPNLFSRRLTPAEWRRLQDNDARPLVNRAIAGQYPPGSTFKPMVVVAALEGGTATPATVFDCQGSFAIGSVTFGCWNRSGHGPLAMRKAVEQSCNVYFCQLGLGCSYRRIEAMAAACGFGQRTGIDLPGELSGLLPSDAWKRETQGDGWRSGDTCNASIGQGFLLVTPLQMAVCTAALANGGYVWRPRLVADGRPDGELVRSLEWSPATLQTVRGGMYDVIQAPSGTGRNAAVEGIEMAGKTGTAEFGPVDQGLKHTWMTLFAPFRDPRYAVAMVVEEGDSGGRTVAPRMKALMGGVLRLEEARRGAAPGGGA